MKHIADTLAAAKWQAIEHYYTDRRPFNFFRHHLAAVESALSAVWQTIFGAESEMCLLAIGGFGRGEFYPHSDLDLAIVAQNELNPEQQDKITQFIQILWDMKCAPAVQSGSLKQLCDNAKTDLSTDTAFLESRYLMGNASLATQFQATVQHQRDIVAFIEGKLLEQQQRHAKQPALMLEPNIKNSAGGLRDIHTMLWLAKVQNLTADFSHLHQNHVINHIEAGMLRSSHRILARLRIELHLAAGREEDGLIFDLQGAVARSLGYTGETQQAIEQLMHQFYRASKNILQLNQIIIPMLRNRVYMDYPRITHDINDVYYQINHKIAIKNPKLFEQQPEHIFGIVQMLQSRADLHAIAPQTLRAWWTAVQSLGDDFYHQPRHRAQFLQFFQMGTGLSQTMRLLNLYGVLAKYLPAWDKIVGLLQHDLFHVYPVDDHILMVLRNVRRLAIDAHSHELPFASGLMQCFEKKYVLYLAALFHDIAKGRNGDHAVLGAVDAAQFAQDHDLPKQDAELLIFLVKQHLLFSIVAQKQDIHDPEVVRRFCEVVDSQEKLIALYLLTVADIRGTNLNIWNTWKAQLLETLFQAASRHLAGEYHHRHTIALNTKQQAFELLKQDYDDKSIRRLWNALGEAYFVYYDETEVAWQLPVLIRQPECGTVHIRDNGDRWQVLIYMENGERLFTRLCRLISQQGLDIVAAKALVTTHDFILDVFTVQLPKHYDANDGTRIQKQLTQKLQAFIDGKRDIPMRTGKPSRRARYLPIAPYALLTPDATRADWYTLEVVAINRSGLLADITEVFARHQVRLYHAKIATLADRAEDVFLLYAPYLDTTTKEWAFKQDVLAVLHTNAI